MELELTTIAQAEPRKRVRLRGTIQSITYSPASAPAKILAVLWDGTASIELRWPGRRSISGVIVGHSIEVEGTVMPATDQNVIVHPKYRILADV